MAGKLSGGAIQSGTITTTQISSALNTTISAGGGPKISTIIYPGDDTAANTGGGQTLYLTGSGFKSNSTVYINGNNVPSVSFISASNLSFTGPVLSAATYPVYVINPEDGATAILIPGLQVSGEPTWVTSATLAEQDATGTWNISLSATGDATITYALAAGSSLPAGISLASNGVISGTLSSPPEADTTYNFTVNAIDAQNQSSSRTFSITVLTSEGILFANNVLLLHADGTNNGNNHSFLDSSSSNFTLTRANNATQGSYSPFSQTGWSAYFDGTGDYLTVPDNAAWDYGTGDFTIECWINPQIAQNGRIYSQQGPSGTGAILFRFNTARTIVFTAVNSLGATLVSITTTSTVSLGTWAHIAIVRSGNVFTIYINGISSATATAAVTLPNISDSILIGAYETGPSEYFGGYISNLRVVKGTAVYTSTFTPPSEPLAPIANTSLLTLQSNRFVDEGPNSFTITRNGDVSIQSFSPFVSGILTSNSHSVYFDGNGDYLSVPDSTAWDYGTDDFTIECWTYQTSIGTNVILVGQYNANDGSSLEVLANNKVVFWAESAYRAYSANTVSANKWNHIAVSRNGTNLRLFLNGVLETTVTDSTNISGSTASLYIGSSASSPGAGLITGSISNVRIVKGTAVYTATFTPPTSPLTAISNTTLLTCQSTALIDNSTNAFTITRNGDARPRRFNPFGQTFTANVVYSTADIGGGAHFDGTGDYLIVGASNLTATSTGKSALAVGSGDFTIEGWFNTSTVSPSAAAIFKHYASPGTNDILEIRLATNTVTVRYRVSGGVEASLASGTITTDQWYHVAFVRNSGVVKGYLNGIEFGSASFTGNLATTLSITTIGCDQIGTSTFTGEISNLRFVKGTALYTTNFVPPTAPFTNIANTSLLCNFTNAQIFDQTAKNVLETVGDAKVSTSVYKYGTGSIAFDGTGDNITIPSSPNLDFGTGDFTIELWINFSALSTNRMILDKWASGNANSWQLYWRASGTSITFLVGASTVLLQDPSTSRITTNTWYHIAVTRSGSTNRLFIDGTQVASATDSTNLTNTNRLCIGEQLSTLTNDLNGYIDDLRITKGYARYTTNFTPPTAKFKDK